VLMLFLGIWSFGSVFVHNPHASLDVVMRAATLQSLGWGSFAPLYLWFVLALVGYKKIYLSWLFGLCVLIFGGAIVCLQWNHLIIVSYVPVYFGWSAVWSIKPLAYIFYFSYLLCVIVAFYFLFDFRARIKNDVKRKQISMIMLTTFIPIIVGSLTNLVLPFFNIRVVPDLGDTVASIWCFVIVYNIVRYKMMTLTPAMAADNIIATMTEGAVIADNQGKVMTVNNAFADLIGYSNVELVGKELLLFFDIGQYAKDNPKEAYSGKSHECVLTAKNGDLVPVLLSVSPLRDNSDAIKGVVCIN
jgi:PAS domain S-box-containing protein